jgi:hypothetical protein
MKSTRMSLQLPVIKFSHSYKKMPKGVLYKSTYIKDIAVIDYKDLTEAQIKEDTETISGEFYQLPKTKLIWIKLWTTDIEHGGKEWGTMRRYTPQKFDYYQSLIGKEVKILIV